MTTAVGTGAATFGGDGGPANAAQINFPADIAVTGNGDYLIADVDNHRIRFVSGLTGTITTVAGTGAPGAFSGDGGPATSAQLNKPSAVALTGDGGFLIADQFNQRIRRVAPDGTISTDAGTGAESFGGDGGPAAQAQLNSPVRVSSTFDGGYLIADSDNHRIRRVSRDGIIDTAAGTGSAGFTGDGGPAPSAQLNRPFGVSVNPEGDYLIADTFNHRIRFVDAGATAPLPPPPGPDPLPAPIIGQTTNAVPQQGTVRVRLPEGTSAARAKALGLAGATRRFIPLDEATQVPLGSTFDTRRGTVGLDDRRDAEPARRRRPAASPAGLFVAKQPRSQPADDALADRRRPAQVQHAQVEGRRRRHAPAPHALLERARALQDPRPPLERHRARHRVAGDRHLPRHADDRQARLRRRSRLHEGPQSRRASGPALPRPPAEAEAAAPRLALDDVLDVVVLADHEELVLAHHDVLHLGDLVARHDDEAPLVGANGVVDVEREPDQQAALLVAALAHESADPELVVQVPRARLVLGDSLLAPMLHSVRLASIASPEWLLPPSKSAA